MNRPTAGQAQKCQNIQQAILYGDTIIFKSEREMNGKPHFKFPKDYSNQLSCYLDKQEPLQHSCDG